MLTVAQKFINKAKEIVPHIYDLQDIDPKIDSADHIDEIMFKKGEYVGGMCSIILALCQHEKEKHG